jgi:uncharacterized protein YegJ (DUF2314 family)
MEVAVAEARRRWPEFVEAFTRPRPGQKSFAVKAPVRDGDELEFAWIQVSRLDGDVIEGILDNEPVRLRNVKIGDTLRVTVGDLNDWIFVDGESLIGGFTLRIVRNPQPPP